MIPAVSEVASAWQLVPHPVSRLVYTLLFMVFVLGTAVLAVRRFSSNRLFSQVVTTPASLFSKNHSPLMS